MFPWYLLSSEKGFWGRQEGASMSSHLSACRASGDRQDGGSTARACCSLPGLGLWGSLVPAQTAPRLAQRAIVAGLEIREWLRSSFWGAAPISPSLAEILHIISYLYMERELYNSTEGAGGRAGKLTADGVAASTPLVQCSPWRVRWAALKMRRFKLGFLHSLLCK